MNTQMIFQEINVSNMTTKKAMPSGSSDKKPAISFNDLLKNIPQKDTAATDTKGKKTFAQVVNNSKAAAINLNNSVSEANKTEELTDDIISQADEQKLNAAADSVINGIAALLGIDSSSLKQLMTQLNIKPEDLLDANKVDDIISQLSLKLGLTAEQEQVLAASVQQFTKLANEAIADTGKNNDSWVVVEGVSFNVVKKDDSLTKSMAHLDEDIKQLAGSIKKDNALLFENIPEKFASLLKDFGINTDTLNDKKSVREDSLRNSEKKEPESEEPKVAKVETKESAEIKTNLLGAKDAGKKSDFAFVQSNDLANQTVQKDDFAAKLQTVATAQRVVRNELMKQVVDQAKVLVNDNRSEMVMQLKPDSLGKLTLKIVTENGIVAAKFVAESQQVKQVLESNMQTLKDSLEKQGMSVQSVSVSVGQQGSQNSGQREAFERRNSKGTAITSDELAFISGSNEDFLDKVNPYEVSDNSIDIIA